MGTFITIVILLACVLLILLVLMQNPKGGGLSTDFGSSHQIGGVKQTNNLIENATWTLAGIIGVLSIVMTLMYHEPSNVPMSEPVDVEQPVQE